VINTLNGLMRKWRERHAEKLAARDAREEHHIRLRLECEAAAIYQCVRELSDAIEGAKPQPLNEASTEKLYKWSGRMVWIMDHMVEARKAAADDDEAGVTVAGDVLGELATQDFLNDIYDLFKQLANRRADS
jgi:hypothetical protein